VDVTNPSNDSTIRIKMDVHVSADSADSTDSTESAHTEEKVEQPDTICKACNKSFSRDTFLKRHLKKYPVCAEWIQTMQKKHTILPKKGIHRLVEEYLHTITAGDVPFQCTFCKLVCTNRNAFHKHFHSFIACNRMALAEFVKQIQLLYT